MGRFGLAPNLLTTKDEIGVILRSIFYNEHKADLMTLRRLQRIKDSDKNGSKAPIQLL